MEVLLTRKFGRFRNGSFSVLAASFLLAACSSSDESTIDSGATSDGGATSDSISSAQLSNASNTSGSAITIVRDTPTETQAGFFLNQATFGSTLSPSTIGGRSIDGQQITNIGLSEWLRREFAAPSTEFVPTVLARIDEEGKTTSAMATDAFWAEAVTADDQLRLRMAYALSQILVVSERSGVLANRPLATAYYMDVLTRNAFGNYRTLLEEVTYSPAMAEFLTYMRNRKADPNKGRVPDENYARELMQLFTIGLVELGRDGLPLPNARETYDTADVEGLSRVFTGLSYKGGFWIGQSDDDWQYSPVQIYPEEHSTLEKSFLGFTIPENTGAAESIDLALDHIMAHPNVGPFVSRQLIQRLTTSNPSGAYVDRVARAFETGQQQLPDGSFIGTGERGDLRATLAAILVDAEARRDSASQPTTFGKVREPVLRFIQWARAFNVQSARARDDFWLRDMARSDRLGQHPFRAPSVFNFYRPGFVSPGSESGTQGLVAPELQITNETTVIGYINIMSRYVRGQNGQTSTSDGNAFRADYTEELTLADNPEALVDHLDRLLTFGQMKSLTRTRIVNALNEMPIRDNKQEDDLESRVHLAVLMTVTSPTYMVQ